MLNKMWYQDDKELEGNRSESLFNLVGYYEKNQTMRIESIRANRMMYGTGAGFSRISNRQANSGINAGPKVTLNICKSQISTLSSRITKATPRLRFSTDGADWILGVKARKLNKFMDGTFAHLKVQKLMRQVFQDAQIDDLGAIKAHNENGEIKLEQIDASTLYADPRESEIGNIRSLYEVKWIQREILAAKFPKYAQYIENYVSADNMKRDEKSEVWFIKCIEAWHLPPSKKGKGRHVICIEEYDLLDEVWKRDSFPFAFFKPGGGMRGLFGSGLASQLRNIQIEINKILRNIQLCLHLTVPKILVPKSSKIDIESINNRIGGIIKYSGAKPEYAQLSSIPPEAREMLDWFIRQAYEITGISQLSATGQKPSGLDSGKALREFSDIETERFALVGKAYEDFALDIGKLVLEEAQMIGGKTNLKANFIKDDVLEVIEWKDIDLNADQYEMSIFPVSSLPSRPEAKLQTVIEMAQSQILSPDESRLLLDFPDLKAFTDKENADFNLIEKILFNITEKGKYTTPDPYMNLTLLKEEAKKAIVYYMLHNLPEDRIEMLRDLIEDVLLIEELASAELEELGAQINNQLQPLPGEETEQASLDAQV